MIALAVNVVTRSAGQTDSCHAAVIDRTVRRARPITHRAAGRICRRPEHVRQEHVVHDERRICGVGARRHAVKVV